LIQSRQSFIDAEKKDRKEGGDFQPRAFQGKRERRKLPLPVAAAAAAAARWLGEKDKKVKMSRILARRQS
jgi:hypothetical protein